jgi:putative SOS response-associated peptidase YedK
MTSRFFRREIAWGAYAAVLDLVPPPGVGAPEAQANIAPHAMAPIFRFSAPALYPGDYAPRGRLVVTPAFWAFTPVWHRPAPGDKPFAAFNARAETLADSAVFSGAFRHGRCLVPASGYYAWSGSKGRATPFALALRERDWFCFAGLWSRAMIDGSEFDTFAIVTVAANDLTAPFGDTMPAILEPADCARWIDPLEPRPERLLKACPEDEMRLWPAHPDVGNVRNQGPEMTREQETGEQEGGD